MKTRLILVLVLAVSICLPLFAKTIYVFDVQGRFVSELEIDSDTKANRVITVPSYDPYLSSRLSNLSYGIYLLRESAPSQPIAPGSLLREPYSFVDITADLLTSPEYNTGKIIVADFNGDNREDYIEFMASYTQSPDSQARIFICNSEGEYIDETIQRLPEFTLCGNRAYLINFQYSGSRDILLVSYLFADSPKSNYLLLNDGTGHFSLANEQQLPPVRAIDACILDINHDGKDDLIYTEYQDYPLQNNLQAWINTNGEGVVNETASRLPVADLAGLLRELPSLPTRHCIMLGAAVKIPVMLEIPALPENKRPRSEDPKFWEVWTGSEERQIDWKGIADEWQGTGPNQNEIDEKETTQDDDVPF